MSATIQPLSKILKNVVKNRCLTTCSGTYLSEKNVRDDLRSLLRELAQPVAVITSFMHPNITENDCPFHGATLSSFTSIAMDPYPLVTFALRVPSRMATSLDAAPLNQHSHMVVNLLSSEQAPVAVKFSRPDLYPEPFSTTSYTLTKEGIPALTGSLGAISCKLVSRAIPLHDLDYLQTGLAGGKDSVPEPILGSGCVASELFIARVTRVELLDSEDERTSPLLYYRRGYTHCPPSPPQK